VVVTLADVTRLKHIEEALERERDFTSAVLSTAGALVVVLDSEGRIVRFNRACERLTGYTFEEVEGRPLWDLVLLPEERDSVQAVFAELSQGQFPNAHENHWVAKDGSHHLIQWSNTALTGAVGNIGYVIAVGLDITEQRRAEEALRESEELFRALFERATDGLILADIETRTIGLANAAVCRLLGYTCEELQGLTIADLHPPEELPRIEAALSRRDPREVEGPIELVVRRKDGSTFPAEVTGTLVALAGGTCLLGRFRDVTERRQAEQERERLLAQVERQRILLDTTLTSTEAHLAYLDRDFNYVWVNAAYARPWQRAPEEFPGHNQFEFVPQEKYGSMFRRVRDAGEPLQSREIPLEYPDRPELGTTYWGLTLTPIKDALGRVEALVLSLVDVTELVRARQRAEEAERARAEEARLFATVLDNARPLLASLDRNLCFVQVNEAYAEFAGLRPEELVGRCWDEVWHDPARVAALERVRDTGEPHEAREQRLENPRRPGADLYTDWSLVPILDAQGAVTLIVLSATDVTEQVRDREALLKAERGRAELAEALNSEIAHRVKNNLAMVAGLLRMQIAEQPEAEISAVLRDTTGRLMAFAAVHEQMQAVGEGDLDLLSVLRHIARANREAFAQTRVVVSVEGEPVFLPHKAATNLAMAANELITNAVKHGAPGADGEVRVDVGIHLADGTLRLSVRNSGNPVPADFDVSRKRGLGLRLVWGLAAEQCGGTFALRPHAGGTTAEVVVEEEKLR
jgi:PAS domain S-box-containing protein